MKKYTILLVAILLLILDIRIPTVAYPAFEAFKTEAPETVDLIINHVVGGYLRPDILSDALGYLLIGFYAVKRLNLDNKSGKAGLWSVVGLGLYIFQNIMPFFLNGNERFRIGYLVGFVAVFLEAAVILKAVYAVCAKLDCVEYHGYNNLTIIILLISVGMEFISEALYFYNLIVLSVIYQVLCLVTMGITWYRIHRTEQLVSQKEV